MTTDLGGGRRQARITDSWPPAGSISYQRREQERRGSVGFGVVLCCTHLSGVDVDVEREGEDGEGGEEDEGVDEDGLAVGAEAAEVDVAVRPRDLEQQPRRQQDEQHHPDHHRAPVSHLPSAWTRSRRKENQEIYLVL